MIHECKILSNNKIRNVIIFDLDGKKIQTHCNTDETVVYVKEDNEKIVIVSKDEYEKSLKKLKKSAKSVEVELTNEAE